jgi:nitrite reductase/ring-hydroxylating ferredoxin subunit
MPSGWFRIATSSELPAGKVGVFQINGQDVVAFRNKQGAVAVVDPICPHMGAHLGYGGRVVDGALRCPFHGLRFDTGGNCVGTEYPGNPEVKLSLRSWPVMEQLGCIFVHAGHDGAAPTWELPEYDTTGWTEPVTKVLTLKGHVQDVAENAVDFGHFAAVHKYSNLEDPVLRIEGPRMYSKFGFTRRNPLLPTSEIQSIFDTDVHGLGLSVTDLRVPKLGIHYRVLLTATQLDEENMSFGIGVSSEFPPPFVPKSGTWAASSLARDDPRSSPSDPPLHHLRRAARQRNLGAPRPNGRPGLDPRRRADRQVPSLDQTVLRMT